MLTVSARRATTDNTQNLNTFFFSKNVNIIVFHYQLRNSVKEVDQNEYKHAYDWSRNSENRA